MKPGADAAAPPPIATLLSQAQRLQTPCGDGSMVWRVWGQGSRDLVLLHGGGGSWAHWALNIPALTGHFRVWVPDLPGMGESAPPAEPWTPRSLAVILNDGIAQLAGVTVRPSLLGFSFGGMLAGHWAALAADRIERIVVVAAAGTALITPPMESMRSWRLVEDPLERREIHRHNLKAWMLHDPARADDLAAWIAQYSVENDRLRNRQVSGTDSLLRAMSDVRCPAHAICGREDVLYKPVQEKLEHAMLRAGFNSFTWLAGAGHWVSFEQPAAFNATALGLLGT